MRYVMVTLGNDDVEWITTQKDIKEAIGNDTRFAEWVAERNLLDALEELSQFHRDVGNQLRRSGVGAVVPPGSAGWAGRALYLVHKLKWRRQQLRALVREQHGQEFLVRTIQSFDARHPREKVTP